jgi:hypothetical protein
LEREKANKKDEGREENKSEDHGGEKEHIKTVPTVSWRRITQLTFTSPL